MASVLKIDTIKSLTGNEAITISESGVPQLNTPMFDVYLGIAANQPITSNEFELVELDTVVVDTHGWFDTNTHRFTPQMAGYYWINGLVGVTGGTSTSLQAGYIYKNGSLAMIIAINRATTASSYYFAGGSLFYLNGTTDYVTLIGRGVYGSTPALVGTSDGTAGCRLSGYLLRAA